MCDPEILRAVKDAGRPGGRPYRDVQTGGPLQRLERAIVGAQNVVDLTHAMHEDFPTYLGQSQFHRRKQLRYSERGINIDTITTSEHVGTHIDAPLHFSEDGQSVDEIPIASLIAPLCVVDIREKVSADADAELTLDDLMMWTERHGSVPPNACVAMLSGWASFVETARFRNADQAGIMHFPGIHPEVADYLLEETEAVGLAVDTLSLDKGISRDFRTHRAWLPAGGWGLECLASLDMVPASGSTIMVGAPKHRGGTGGAARAFALF